MDDEIIIDEETLEEVPQKPQKRRRGRPTREEAAAKAKSEYERLKATFEPAPAKAPRLPRLTSKTTLKLDDDDAERFTKVFMVQSGILDDHPEDTAEAAQQRMIFINYMHSCSLNRIIPSNLGVISALHISKETWSKTLSGTWHQELTPLYTQIAGVLGAIREQLGMQSRINPATLIFWAKNFDGLKDEQEMVVGVRDQFGALPDGKQLAEKYATLPDK